MVYCSGHENHKFIASDPRDNITVTEMGGYSGGQFRQHRIAKHMPVPVVYHLEIIYVDNEHGRAFPALAKLQKPVDLMSGRPFIVQLCQYIPFRPVD